MEEPKNNKERLDDLLKIGDLDEEAVKHVKMTMRLSSLLHLFSMNENILYKNAIKEEVFGLADAVTILSLKAWLVHTRKESGGKLPSKWLKEMTQEHFEEFVMSRVDEEDKATTSTAGQTTTDTKVTGTSSPRMSDYPYFSGKMDDWYEFKDQFEGTAQGQGMGIVLQDYKDDDPVLDDEAFKKHSAFIYSVLKRNCAKGTAAVKVRKFSEDNDGHRAWVAMKQYYESHGSVEQYVADCMTELAKLKLDYNSHMGFEKYVSDFETLCLRLEEAKDPLSDIQKKTRFLAGFNDRDYNEIVTICRHAKDMSFDETVREVRSEAKAKGKLKNNKPTRQANNSRSDGDEKETNRKSKFKKNKDGYLPPELWAKMTPEQRTTYLNGKKNGAREFGMQYSKGEEKNAQSKPDESTANFNTAEQVKEEPRPSGNIWRSTPKTKMVASMKTVRLTANRNITGTTGQAPRFTGRKNKVKKMAMAKKIRNC